MQHLAPGWGDLHDTTSAGGGRGQRRFKVRAEPGAPQSLRWGIRSRRRHPPRRLCRLCGRRGSAACRASWRPWQDGPSCRAAAQPTSARAAGTARLPRGRGRQEGGWQRTAWASASRTACRRQTVRASAPGAPRTARLSRAHTERMPPPARGPWRSTRTRTPPRARRHRKLRNETCGTSATGRCRH
jgi:hypothetical protein